MGFSRRLFSRRAISTAGKSADELQHTLSKPVTRRGIGLHSGKEASVTLVPTTAGKGRFFTWKDVSEEEVPASASFVVESRLSTCLGSRKAKFCTVEHLLSALEALGVDNCHIQLDGYNEIPLLDGSALPWAEAIEEAGISVAEDEMGNPITRSRYRIQGVVHVSSNDSFVAAFPAPASKLTCGIDFSKYPAIGTQWFTWTVSRCSYREEIAGARTFGLHEQIETLRSAGLIKGGSLDNSLVCSMENGWLNPPLRYEDEPCRHKLLDLLGDLSLCSRMGHPGLPIGHVIAYKASHSLHTKFCQELLKSIHGQDDETSRALHPASSSKACKGQVRGTMSASGLFCSKRFVHLGSESTSFVDVIYRVRHRKKAKGKGGGAKEKVVQTADRQLVNTIVGVLNETVYVDELPEKLSQYQTRLSTRDIAMILKLVGDVRLAFGFFNWVKEQNKAAGLDLDVFLTLVHRLLAARKWDDLSRVVDGMHENNFYLDYGLFEAVIKEASGAMQLDVCERWYKLMQDISVKPNVFIFNLMIRVYNRHGRYRDALKVFEDMGENKVKPTVVTYSQLFSACKDMVDSQTAKALHKKMKVQGVRLDQVGYTTLMNVYAKAGQPDQAEELFRSMKEQGLKPDIYLLNCLLESYAKANMLDKAVAMFDGLSTSGCRASEATYVIMLGLYCKAGLYDKATELLRTVNHEVIKLGEQFYIILIKAYAGAGRWDDTITVFNEMQSSSCRIRGSIYVLMLEVTFKAGYYEACEEVFSAILDKGINRTSAVYETMIRACERLNRMSRICDIFIFMQEMLCPFTESVYSQLHGIFTRTENKEMLTRLEGIKEAGKVFAD